MSLISLIVSWLVSSAAVFVTAEVLPGFTVKGVKGALAVAAVLGLLQAIFGGLLYAMIGLGTLGIGFLLGFATRILVTAILLVLTDKFLDSLKIKSFGTALVGAVVISLVSTVAGYLLPS